MANGEMSGESTSQGDETVPPPSRLAPTRGATVLIHGCNACYAGYPADQQP